MQWGAKVIVLVCLVGVVCVTGYLVGTHEWRSAGATAANLAPPNDDFADAAPLVGAAGARGGTTAGATLENGEDHLYLERGSVWFKWKAPWSGWATFHTCGSRFDTELDVYTGPSLLELQEVYLRADACARGDAWHADFEAAAGTVYRIAVGAAYRGNKGPFTLRWGRYPERTSARGSCFFSTKGVLRWCLGRGANSWDPCSASTVYKDRRSRYWVEEGHTVWGYVRTAGPGRWRAMVGPGPQGWSRDGTIVRAAGGRWIVRNFRGRSLGFARGPHPVAVGAYRLLAGNC
jgi:hypothetical protein